MASPPANVHPTAKSANITTMSTCAIGFFPVAENKKRLEKKRIMDRVDIEGTSKLFALLAQDRHLQELLKRLILKDIRKFNRDEIKQLLAQIAFANSLLAKVEEEIWRGGNVKGAQTTWKQQMRQALSQYQQYLSKYSCSDRRSREECKPPCKWGGLWSKKCTLPSLSNALTANEYCRLGEHLIADPTFCVSKGICRPGRRGTCSYDDAAANRYLEMLRVRYLRDLISLGVFSPAPTSTSITSESPTQSAATESLQGQSFAPTGSLQEQSFEEPPAGQSEE